MRHPSSARFTLSTQAKLFLALAAIVFFISAAIIATVRPTGLPGREPFAKQAGKTADSVRAQSGGAVAKMFRPFRSTSRGEDLKDGRFGCPYDLDCRERETDREKLERYMPVPGEEEEESEALDRLESEWHNRLTYPTGIFNPAWIRQALAQDA